MSEPGKGLFCMKSFKEGLFNVEMDKTKQQNYCIHFSLWFNIILRGRSLHKLRYTTSTYRFISYICKSKLYKLGLIITIQYRLQMTSIAVSINTLDSIWVYCIKNIVYQTESINQATKILWHKSGAKHSALTFQPPIKIIQGQPATGTYACSR